MAFVYLLVMAVISFGLWMIGEPFFKKDTYYTLAIGGAIGSNVFNISVYGFSFGNIVFGVDSIVYTLFVFCVVSCLAKYGKKEAFRLTLNTMAAIFVSGIITLIASWATVGMSFAVVWNFISFIISILATFAAIWVAILVFKKLEGKWNIYLNVLLFLIIASLVNSIIYFGVVAICNGGFASNFGYIMAGSYIGKGIALVFAMIVFAFNQLWYKKKGIDYKVEE